MTTTATLEIIALGKDQASAALSGVGSSVSGLGSVAAGVATGGLALAAAAVVGLGAAAVGAAAGVTSLAMAAADVEGSRQVFERLEGNMGSLKDATRKMVNETDLMAASNKLMTMGIADTTGEVAEMAEMATQLGLAMKEDATKSMENWTLMMANQSIPRLDSFGISSAKVRERIDELMRATEGLSREEAFKIAVMEEGRKAMERVGEQGESATATTLRWKAAVDDLGYGIGKAFVPALEAIRKPAVELAEEYGPRVVGWAEKAGGWLGEKLPIALGALKEGWEFIQPGLIWAKNMFEAFTTTYLPQLRGAWDILKKGWDEISGLYHAELKPALEDLWKSLGLGTGDTEDIAGAFGSFLGILTKIMASGLIEEIRLGIKVLTGIVEGGTWAIEKIKGALDAAKGALNSIKSAIDKVKSAFESLKNAISGFELPWWLQPGSPTPLETGLWGIGKALAEVQGLTGGGLGFGGMSLAGAGATGGRVVAVNIINHFGPGSVRDDGDILEIADAITKNLELRGIGPVL